MIVEGSQTRKGLGHKWVTLAGLCCLTLFLRPVLGDIQNRIDALLPDRVVEDRNIGPLQVLGYEIRSSNLELDEIGPNVAVQLGDSIHCEVFWKLVGRPERNYQGSIQLGNLGASAQIEDENSRPISSWRVGEVNRQTFSFVLEPRYSQHFPPIFYYTAEYPFWVEYGSDGPPNFNPVRIRAGTIRTAPEVPIEDGILCLSNNKDIATERRLAAVKSISYPDGEPSRGSKATDIYDELVDGIFSGSGSAGWENVFWTRGNWGADSRRIVFEMDRDVKVEEVVLAYNSTYPNFLVDKIEIALSSDGKEFILAGEYDDRQLKRSRGLQLLSVSGERKRARYISLRLSRESGATTLPVSEVFIFGRPLQ